MDRDKVKGTMDDAIGRTKRQIGEWTDDPEKQVEGTVQQVKGKVEKISGNIKDSVRDATNSPRQPRAENEQDVRDRERATTHRR